MPTAALRTNARARLALRAAMVAAVVFAQFDARAAAQAPAPPQNVRLVSGPPAVDASSLVYDGAFRLPWLEDRNDLATFQYGGSALAFNPQRGSLFLVGHAHGQRVAEVTIPDVRKAEFVTDLATASLIQGFFDVFDGKGPTVSTTSAPVNVGGLYVHQGKLLSTAYIYYDADNLQQTSHFSSSLNLADPSDAAGPFAVWANGKSGYVDGYMASVPASWQPVLGGPLLTGQCCIPIVSRTSNGPAAFTFDPSNLGTRNPVPAQPLVYYTLTNQLDSMSGGRAAGVTGAVFPEGTRSLLFFGSKGTGELCYGPGTSDQSLAGTPADGGVDKWCYDPTAPLSKGYHSYPYLFYVWAYDANDLAAVKAGKKNPWELRPYAEWPLPLPFTQPTVQQVILGAAYDPATGRIFVSQQRGDAENPVIHVFRVRL